jgi:arginyl-tRNA synthetase
VEGNSGPYLQYAHARAQGILAKLGNGASQSPILTDGGLSLEAGERLLARQLAQYGDVVGAAAQALAPHQLCTYLYDLATVFNRFYEHHRVAGDERELVRASLVAAYAHVQRDGLSLLGIEAPDRM